MRVVLSSFVRPLKAVCFTSLLCGFLCGPLLSSGVAAQEEAKEGAQEKKEAGEAAADLPSLVKAFTEAGNGKAKRELVEKIFAIEGALDKVDAMIAENEKLKPLGDALKMQIIVSAFRDLEKKHPGSNLTYAGQFDGLKKHGKRAADGALLLMKDYTLHTDADRAKAWEVLADLGDKSVIPELKKISEDFLFTDGVQLGALYAMAALGDASGIEKKVQEYKDRAKEEPNRQIGHMMQIAFIYTHGRMYDKAIAVQNGLIRYFREVVEKHGAEMPAQQKAQFEGNLANLYYNSACSHSLMKDYKWAYIKLQLCLALAHDNYIKLIPRDGDFRNLRTDKNYEKWFGLAKAKKLPPLKLKKAAAEGKEGKTGEGGEQPSEEKPKPDQPKADPKEPGGEKSPKGTLAVPTAVGGDGGVDDAKKKLP